MTENSKVIYADYIYILELTHNVLASTGSTFNTYFKSTIGEGSTHSMFLEWRARLELLGRRHHSCVILRFCMALPT